MRSGVQVVAVLATLAGTSARAFAECVVRGETPDGLASARSLTVRPEGVHPFPIKVETGEVSARIGSGRGEVDVHVDGAISFDVRAQGIWYSVKEPVRTEDGFLRLVPGAHLVDVRARGDDTVEGTLVLTVDDYALGDDKKPDEVAKTVAVPCRALTLDWVEPRLDLDLKRDFELPVDGSWWRIPRGRSVDLRAEPRASAAKVLVGDDENLDGHFAWGRLETRGSWVKVARLGQSAAITGWIQRSRLEATDIEGGRSGACTGQHGPGLSLSHVRVQPATGYEGAARVAAGTKVYAEAGRGAWAVVRGDETFKVRWDRGAKWAALTTIPGLETLATYAFVPVAAITPTP